MSDEGNNPKAWIPVSDLVSQLTRDITKAKNLARWETAELNRLQQRLVDFKDRADEWCDFFYGLGAPESGSMNGYRPQTSTKAISDIPRKVSTRAKATHPPREVYISYAWEAESEFIRDGLEQALAPRGLKVSYDRNTIRYKDSLTQFMEEVGSGKCVIAIIGKKYLESKNCMFELLSMVKQGEWRSRIFPYCSSGSKYFRRCWHIGVRPLLGRQKAPLGTADQKWKYGIPCRLI